MAILILTIIVDVIFGLICYELAKRKGRNTGAAFITGLFFNILALLYYVAVGHKEGTPRKKLKSFRLLK